MALTDHSDLYASFNEGSFNRLVAHIARQRPTLFNYGTALFDALSRKKRQLCDRIDVVEGFTGPLISVEEPLPIIGSPVPIGIDWCFQLGGLAIDFHPSSAVAMPAELGTLAPQRFALKASGCFGLMCPDDAKLDQLLSRTEAAVVTAYEDAFGLSTKERARKERQKQPVKGPIVPLPPGRLNCFCMSLTVVGHLVWGEVGDSEQPWLKVRVDNLEIADIRPERLETMLECYLRNVLRFGVLPRLMLPLEALVLDITAQSTALATYLGRQLVLAPTPVSPSLPFNPAIEGNELKVFVNIRITG